MKSEKKYSTYSHKTLKSSMIAGLTAGIILSQTVFAADQKTESAQTAQKKKGLLDLIANTDGNITYHLMTEDELLIELNESGTKIYRSLSPEGKALAIKLASRSCNGTNECKGQNACRSDKNSCYGQGSCKGQTKCGFANKNDAMKLASDLMAKKREGLKK